MTGAERESADPRSRDAAARRLACTEFARPLALEAGAGTGKTLALVHRIVCWTIGPGWERAAQDLAARDPSRAGDEHRIASRVLDRVVAITFTEAAAAEMAERVGEVLHRLASGQRDDLHFPPGLPEGDAGVIAARARALSGCLERLVVRTIHGFCRRVLSMYPVEAGVAPGFEVDAHRTIVAELAHEVLVERAPELFTRPELAEPLSRMFSAGIELSDIEQALVDLAAADLPAERLGQEPRPRDVAVLVDRLVARGRELDQLVAPLGAVGRKLKDRDAAVELAGFLEALRTLDVEAPGAFGQLVDAARTREALAERLGAWKRGSLSKTAAEALASGTEGLAPLARRFLALFAALRAVDPGLLPAARTVLRPLLSDLEQRLARRGALGFDALLVRTRDLLGDDRIAAEVRARIDQLLVDEFQDTDALQCEIVARLALEGDPASRPGLFVVGDPKQSIYAFRGADLAAFEDLRRRMIDAGGALEALSVNFRSNAEVLDEVERLLSPVMREVPGLQPPFEPLVSARGGDETATVETWISWQADDDGAPRSTGTLAGEAVAIEARAIAEDIRRRRERDRTAWSEFAILLRATGDIEAYLGALREAGVPYAVTRDRQYFRRREVIDAAALLRAVIDPSDTLALVTFLRSAAGGLPDAALIPLWGEGLPEIAARLVPPDSSALDRARAAVDRAAAHVGTLAADIPGIERLGPWPDAVRAALEHLFVLRGSFREDRPELFLEKLRALSMFEPLEAGRFLGAFRLANLGRLFDEVLSALGGERVDPEALLRALRRSVAELVEAEEARPEAAAEDAVQVITIHGSKGLGFEHVYVPQLHRGHGGRRARRPRTFVLRRGGVEGLVLFDLPDAQALAAGADLAEATRAEQVRLLYVAMTRARRRLVLCACPGTRASAGESLLSLIEGDLVPADAVETWTRLNGQGHDSERRGARVLRFPALAADAAGRTRRKPGAPADETRIEAWLESADGLGRKRRDADSRQRKRFAARMSDRSPALLREQLDPWTETEEPGEVRIPRDRVGDEEKVARLAGTLVHRALERVALDGPIADGLREQAGRLEEYATPGVPARVAAPAARRARELLRAVAEGPLAGRLERISGSVLGRELPLVATPEALGKDSAVGYVSGVIDLLYRDPESGTLVVADYKTDELPDDDAVDARVEAYRPQVIAYREALAVALGRDEPVRAELWFLARGVVREVGP